MSNNGDPTPATNMPQYTPLVHNCTFYGLMATQQNPPLGFSVCPLDINIGTPINSINMNITMFIKVLAPAPYVELQFLGGDDFPLPMFGRDLIITQLNGNIT